MLLDNRLSLLNHAAEAAAQRVCDIAAQPAVTASDLREADRLVGFIRPLSLYATGEGDGTALTNILTTAATFQSVARCKFRASLLDPARNVE